MQFSKFLALQLRPKVDIALADNTQCKLARPGISCLAGGLRGGKQVKAAHVHDSAPATVGSVCQISQAGLLHDVW